MSYDLETMCEHAKGKLALTEYEKELCAMLRAALDEMENIRTLLNEEQSGGAAFDLAQEKHQAIRERDKARDEVKRQAALIRGPLSQAVSDAREECDEALAEVALLRALLAEPSEEDVWRLACLAGEPPNALEARLRVEWVRRILAALRERAGGGE